ncbi:Stk1 family PASTA domain-containing Ser/Thr kinase [Yonghaparkia sp. Soil809]|uniref:Stk1 family PASTA domain-containing Ser/Thr kinase n=1 Tax=Yonghaparkia sp. Soil809 TaxID=1736417 RepID=UPI0006F3D801|nr:Stk1 family PASTA domain-containing Ser/Thr kinase [Yonghaparkia sp. Soil809]KRF33262.1 serine/threonine protein kinase [Yonghaparkia sp. Soil809]
MIDGTAQSARLLAGRYQLGSLIGRGGMSDVHIATDARLGRRVAVKLLKSSLASDPVFRTRFRQEAQAAARMAHPTIVRVFDAGEESVTEPGGGETISPFIVMEHVEGRLLKDVIADGPVDPAEATRIIEGVLTALEYSHRAGVVHRDIKPGNIMITNSGQVKVMDFGIARAVSDSAATVAQTSTILGTAQYFSPEQARGETVDARSDLYSTGVVLFEMLTGRAPFRGDSPVAVAYQHVSEAPVAPSTIVPSISPALDAVVLHALAKDRFERFQTAADFRSDVAAAAAGQVPPKRVDAPTDFSATLFGVNPQATADTEAAMRQLSVDDEERRTRTQSRPPVAWIWAGIAVLAVVVASVLFWAFNLERTQLAPSISVTVADVTGQAYEDGAQRLVDDGLTPNPFREASADVPEGDILRTVPAAGVTVSPGQEVRVYVSTGPPTVQVPNIDRLSLGDAQVAIEAVGLRVGTITAENSPNIRKDIVIRTDPAVGAEVREGDTIAIVISSGLITVPDVRNLPIGDATAQLSPLQLQIRVQGNNGCSGGLVTNQSLAPGDQPQNSEITLTWCSGVAGGSTGDTTGTDGTGGPGNGRGNDG